MLHDNLVPPSPLMGTTTVMPSRLALEPRDVLEGKKAELETRVRGGAAWVAAGAGGRARITGAGLRTDSVVWHSTSGLWAGSMHLQAGCHALHCRLCRCCQGNRSTHCQALLWP